MKSSAKTLLIVGALGAAAIYAAQRAQAASDAAQEAGGSLGGSDDSLTNDNNPFAGIDPNYQYPSNNYFVIQPDGTVVPTSINPDTGAITIPTPDGEQTTNPSGPDIGPASTGEPNANPSGPQWYENPLIQGAGFAAGYIAVEGSLGAVKKIVGGKTTGEKLVSEGSAKSEAKFKTTEKSPLNEVREKMGFRANERLPEQEILRAKYTTESDFSTGKVSEVKGTGKIMAEEPTSTGKVKFGETKIGKTAGQVGETAGKALIIGHVVSRSFGAWNDYGSSYLEPRMNSKGDVVGATAGSTAKAVGVTAAVGTTGILGDLFSFGTGLIYRPPTNAEDRKGEETGWFATEKDLYSLGKEALTNPGAALQQITGIDQIKKAVSGGGSSNQKVNTAPAPITTTPTQTVKASSSSAPATITSSNVSASKSSSSSGSSSSSKATSSSSKSSSSATSSFTSNVFSGASYNASTSTYTNASGQKQSMAASAPAAKAATQVSSSSSSKSSSSTPAKAAAPAPAKQNVFQKAVSSIKSIFTPKKKK